MLVDEWLFGVASIPRNKENKQLVGNVRPLSQLKLPSEKLKTCVNETLHKLFFAKLVSNTNMVA